MPIPDFVRDLRSHIGTRPLWMSGINAVILDDDGRVLLTRRADSGRWALLGGIVEPGEEPADTVVREAWEEAGVHVVPERLVSVSVDPPIVHANGDHAQYLALTFRCRLTGGEARVNDDESLEVGWFPPEHLPAGLRPFELERLEQALTDEERTWFALSAGDVTGGADGGSAEG
ncbi:NUDIX hydrolase [Streptacidiphilus rugosus]|uniref:NUDIX hydrolase n=1 Tax=Streptacidiphilus rugosus TaxID=405783 RepID=UPI00055D441B|nr:NUDIX domain-containing protein [Streptacidiphilus rugosus]